MKKELYSFMDYFHNHVKSVNDSKIFAGIMIITLNIASKFVNIKLSKTMESYLKNTFSRQILVFAIAWMGTRDVYIAFVISLIFVILADYLFNEESPFCVLNEKFTNHHLSLLETTQNAKVFTKDDVDNATALLTKAQAILNDTAKIPVTSSSYPSQSVQSSQPHFTY